MIAAVVNVAAAAVMIPAGALWLVVGIKVGCHRHTVTRYDRLDTEVKDDRCAPERLAEIARLPYLMLRYQVTQHLACPSETLEWLAAQPHTDARCFPSGIKGVPPSAEERRVSQKSIYLGVAAHPHCPVGALVRLAGDTDPLVVSMVAGNPRCPVEVLTLLLSRPEPALTHLKYIVAANPNCPEHLKLILALSRD